MNLMQNTFANYQRELRFDFAKHSSIGCGGYAVAAYYPKTAEEFVELVSLLSKAGEPFTVLGNLTNVLPPDGKSQNTVISTKRLTKIAATQNGVYALSGVSSSMLLKTCKGMQKSGVEFLEGIPCTLGGALYMNAGVAGSYVSEIVESVDALIEGKLVCLSVADCEYAYKSSVFMRKNSVIIGAALRLRSSNAEEITAKTEYYRARRAHLPKGRSMGCVFKNPSGAVAGKLIEGAGLKGLRIGGVHVSETHANFIINDGGATSAEIKRLIGIIKNAVFAQYKIRLEEEIRYLP